MGFMKTIFGNLGSRIWFIVTVVLLVLLIAVSIVATTVLSGLMNTVFGGDRGQVIGAAGDYYTPDEGITDKASSLAAANALNERISEEGTILLKNEDNTLPIDTSSSAPKISVFGKNSVDLVYGSQGSAGGNTTTAVSLYDSLEEAGFDCNPVLQAFYEDDGVSGTGRPSTPSMLSGSVVTGFATGETPVSSYETGEVMASLQEYNDAAIVVISRVSGENYDLPTTMKETDGSAITGAMSPDDHYLELDENEQNMLRLACESSENVILVLNSSTPVELGFLDGNNGGDATMLDYDFASKVKAALWIGLPGDTGISALGKVLNGTVNPSGKTVDTFARDFMSIPAVANYSCNGEVNSDAYTYNGSAQQQWFIDYEEGIYVGYRYFETRGAGDEEWYDNNVVYPFGYGLSYTTFSQTIKETNIEAASSWDTETTGLSITVTVTNTGDRAGKEVVEVYAHAPYTPGEIEKAEAVLVGFAKTDMLYPASEAGEGKPNSQDITITFDPYDFASYDYDNANDNGHTGYELDAGDYTFTVNSDAHIVLGSVTTHLGSDVNYSSDPVTGYDVVNRFADVDDQLVTKMSRNDWTGTAPAFRTAAEKAITQDFLTQLSSRDSGNPLTATSEIVVETNAKRTPATAKRQEGMQLYEVIGLEYDDAKWDEMLSRITLSTIWDTLSSCAFNTPSVDYIGKPATLETDGPAGFVNFMNATGQIYDTCFYGSECILAATWNADLAYEMGVSIGNEGLMGDRRNADNVQPYSGWYAPGVNIHRTPFGGRNPEYYSEDCYLSGVMAAQVAKGAASKGVYTFVKHFAVNDQETHRGGVCTWLTEQTMREIYLKPFEIAVKEGGTTAMMSSFNRIGTKWTGGDYRLLTEVLRNEWGFRGTVICDFASGQSHMDFEQQIYAGGDTWLDTITLSKWYDANDALDVYVLQEAMKHCLYTVANSCAMNGLGEGATYQTSMAYWRIVLIVIDVVVPVGLAVWGFFAIRGALRKEKSKAKTQ